MAYFGQSFGRVGADFRILSLPILEQAALAEFARLESAASHRSTLPALIDLEQCRLLILANKVTMYRTDQL